MTDNAATQPVRKVMIINGSTDILEMFESALDPGHYDVVFVQQLALSF